MYCKCLLHSIVYMVLYIHRIIKNRHWYILLTSAAFLHVVLVWYMIIVLLTVNSTIIMYQSNVPLLCHFRPHWNDCSSIHWQWEFRCYFPRLLVSTNWLPSVLCTMYPSFFFSITSFPFPPSFPHHRQSQPYRVNLMMILVSSCHASRRTLLISRRWRKRRNKTHSDCACVYTLAVIF